MDHRLGNADFLLQPFEPLSVSHGCVWVGPNTTGISWLAKSNVIYQIMRSSDLQETWENAPSGQGSKYQSLQTAPMDGLLQYADPDYAGATNAFYRVNVVQ